MRVALIVTTYERPDALAAVLESIASQRVAPAEIIIADDGSGAPTRQLIEGFSALSTVPVRAVYQEHDGFRLTRLRNLAIAATHADYLVFVDGDMLLHPLFIADHLGLARAGFFTQGIRVRADHAFSRELIADPATPARLWSPGLGLRRRVYLLHSRRLAVLMRRLANNFISIKGCNQAYWREDLLRANGFNEAMRGWGPEDKELCVRLANAGVRRQTLLFGGIACHLHHEPASRLALPANLAILDAARRERKQRCELGLDAHLP